MVRPRQVARRCDPKTCFVAGTHIGIPTGVAAVETLAPGDLVLTTDGEARPIVWVGQRTVSIALGEADRVLPVRIAAGALAEHFPVRDLRVSADHALLIDGVLVQAAALVNGTSISLDTAMAAVFTYVHVALAEHALILAEGVAAETFIGDRLGFDHRTEHAAGPNIAELPLPRAKSARQVPASARARIAARALVLAGSAAT